MSFLFEMKRLHIGSVQFIFSTWKSCNSAVLPKWVYRVDSCPDPIDIYQWINASKALNCHHDLMSTDPNEQASVYHCMPSIYLNETVEFCGRSVPIAPGDFCTFCNCLLEVFFKFFFKLIFTFIKDFFFSIQNNLIRILIIIVFYLSLKNQGFVQFTITEPHSQLTTIVRILPTGVHQRCFTLRKYFSVSGHQFYWSFHFDLIATNTLKIYIVTENSTMLWHCNKKIYINTLNDRIQHLNCEKSCLDLALYARYLNFYVD